jgi:hypothetical protein
MGQDDSGKYAHLSPDVGAGARRERSRSVGSLARSVPEKSALSLRCLRRFRKGSGGCASTPVEPTHSRTTRAKGCCSYRVPMQEPVAFPIGIAQTQGPGHSAELPQKVGRHPPWHSAGFGFHASSVTTATTARSSVRFIRRDLLAVAYRDSRAAHPLPHMGDGTPLPDTPENQKGKPTGQCYSPGWRSGVEGPQSSTVV